MIALVLGIFFFSFMQNCKIFTGAVTEPANPSMVVGTFPLSCVSFLTLVSSKFDSLFTVLECNCVGTGRGNVHLPQLSGLLWQALVWFWARVSMVLLYAL